MTDVFVQRRSFADLTAELLDDVLSWIVLEPELPSAQLTERAIEEADRDLAAGLSRHLLAGYSARLIRIERAKQRRGGRGE